MKPFPPPQKKWWIFLSKPTRAIPSENQQKKTKNTPVHGAVALTPFFPPNHQPFRTIFIPSEMLQPALPGMFQRLPVPFSPKKAPKHQRGKVEHCLFLKFPGIPPGKQTSGPLKNNGTGRQAFSFEMARLLGICWFSGGCTPRSKHKWSD